MKKLTLDLEALAVESFAADADGGQGTVLGHEEMMATPGRSCLRTACCPDTYEPGCTG